VKFASYAAACERVCVFFEHAQEVLGMTAIQAFAYTAEEMELEDGDADTDKLLALTALLVLAMLHGAEFPPEAYYSHDILAVFRECCERYPPETVALQLGVSAAGVFLRDMELVTRTYTHAAPQ
jgi:hypothetical protein